MTFGTPTAQQKVVSHVAFFGLDLPQPVFTKSGPGGFRHQGEAMNVCTSCQLCYEDVYSLCANDQSELVNSPPASPYIAKKYRLDWLLGRGRLGVVFEGTILDTERRVAIKLLMPDLAGWAGDLKQLRAEAYA